MIKKEVAVIGLGLAGETVGYGFQQRNYHTLLINGSEQDNQTISSAKNVLVLRGYDGLAGDRNLALEALKNNIDIVKKIKEIEQKLYCRLLLAVELQVVEVLLMLVTLYVLIRKRLYVRLY